MKRKIIGIVIMCAMLLTAVPAQAQNPTNESLLALIAQLQAQIAALAGNVGSGSTASHTFTVDLTIGSRGADVIALQDFLISRGHLTMPVGVAKGYFGALTQSALASYQAANGISPASGYFGPITRARVNQSMVVTPPTTPPTTPNTPPVSTNDLRGGAGDITVTERNSGTEDEVLEGKNEVRVLGFEIKAEGSDIRVTSVRAELKHLGSGSTRLNRYADQVDVMMGSQVVGSANARSFSESRDVYSRNIPVSGVIVREGDTQRFYVAISAVNNVDSRDIGKDWEVALGQIRFEDATGAILTDNTGGGIGGSISEIFTFEDLTSSGDVELRVAEDNDQFNRSRTVRASDSRDTNDVEILSFTLEARGSDMYLNSMKFEITSNGSGVTEIANDFRLEMNGDEIGRARLDRDCDNGNDGFSANADTSVCVHIDDIDDDDIVVDEGDKMSFLLLADINEVGGNFMNGHSLSVMLDADDVDAEDENGDDVEDLTGFAESENIRFASTGVNLGISADNSADRILNLDTTNSDDQGRFTINFEVTAFDRTAFIALTAASSTETDPTLAGVYAYIEDANGNDVAVGNGTTVGVLERVSGGSQTGGYVRINPGQTARMRLTIYHDAEVTGIYRAQLHAVNFANTAVAGTSQQLAVPTSDYQSPAIQILN